MALKPKSLSDSKLEGWEKRDGPWPTKSPRKQIYAVGQSNGGPKEIVNPKGSLEGLNDLKKNFKDTGAKPMLERKSIPRTSLRRQEIREERRMEGLTEEEKEELQCLRYVPTKSQLSSSPIFLDRAPIREGLFGKGVSQSAQKGGSQNLKPR